MANTIRDIVSSAADIGLATPAGSSAAARDTTSSATIEPVPSVGGDKTTLSPLGGLFSSSLRSASAMSSFRAGRVAELKAAVANGTYKPDLDKVAERVAQALKGAAL